MSIRNNTRQLVGYGIDNALQNLAPQPIIANRAPTTADTAPYGSLWIYQATNQVWVLTSIVSALANWELLEASGMAGVFSSLTVNPGPVTTSGTGAVNISADATATTVNLGTGAGAKTVTVGSTNTTSTTVVQSGSGGLTLNGNTGVLGIETTNQTIGIFSGTGTIGVSTDAAATSINIGTGAAAKTVTLGSTNTTSTTLIQGGSGKTSVVNNSNVAGAVSLTTDGGTTETIVVTNTLGTGAGAITLNAAAGGITVEASKKIAISTTDNAVAAIGLTTNGGTTETILITNTQGTATGAITLDAVAGGIELEAVGEISISTSNNSSTALVMGATTGTSSEVYIFNTQGTGAAAIELASAAGGVTLSAGSGGVTVAGSYLALPGPVYIYTGAGVPSNGLALHVGDMYINTTAASATTRLYIATAASTWTNVTCAG